MSISSTFYARFFADILVPKNFKPKAQHCNFWCQNFAQKMRIDEIDHRQLDHKTFFIRYFSRHTFAFILIHILHYNYNYYKA